VATANPQRVRNYKDLIVWQRALQLVKAVYALTARFPENERYGLAVQMQRAAVFLASNIAEGQARNSTKEFLQFLSHAGGPVAELETQLIVATDVGYCSGKELEKLGAWIGEIQRMLAGLRRSLSSAH